MIIVACSEMVYEQIGLCFFFLESVVRIESTSILSVAYNELKIISFDRHNANSATTSTSTASIEKTWNFWNNIQLKRANEREIKSAKLWSLSNLISIKRLNGENIAVFFSDHHVV